MKIEEVLKNILLITFTNAGAAEMKERVAGKLMAEGFTVSADDIQAMTFNTFAYNIVKEFFTDCGFRRSPRVIDNVRENRIIAGLLNKTEISGLNYKNFETDEVNCKGALAAAKATFATIKKEQVDLTAPGVTDTLRELLGFHNGKGANVYQYMSDQSIDELVDLYLEYDKLLKEENLITFADQEPMALKCLDLYPDYLESLGYSHIIVDEFQDSNDIQLEMIRRLCATKCFKSLMVVGDDSQSIFGFRGTTPENMLYFKEKTGFPVQELYMVENYRSTKEILGLANSINGLNKNKVDKDLISAKSDITGKVPVVRGFYSPKDEYKWIAEQIKRMLDSGEYEPEDIAFIAGTKQELINLSGQLSEVGIPWVMMNPMLLLENSRVKAALALANAFYEPESTGLYLSYLSAKYDGELFNLFTDEEIETEIKEMRAEFMNMDMLEFNFQQKKFHDYLEAIKGTDEIYAYFLDLLYANEDFPSELQYTQDFQHYGKKEECKMEQSYKGVVLTTAHSSKGLEWRVVFNSLSKYDSKILHRGHRSDDAVEEKRRLLFVSLTRAREELYVTGQYVAYGSKEDRTYNQFLKEVFDVLDPSGKSYIPVDPMEAVREEERREKARQKQRERYMARKAGKVAAEIEADDKKAKAAKARGDKSRTMTAEEKKVYNDLTKNAKQITLADVVGQ